MQETGIVRRIDELGRIVVPKEMRKTMRIREGDPLEIYLEKDCLVFRKYSPVKSISANAKSIADGIDALIGKACLITDSDKIIYASKSRFKHLIGKSVSSEAEKVFENRKSRIESRSNGGQIIPLYDADDFQYENQIIVPIISNGDCLGSVIIFDDDKFNRLSVNDLKFVQLGATFLSKQFD